MKNKAFILITAAFLAGCSFRPDMPNVDTNFTSTYSFETSDIRDLWWKEFHDENLNALVESALEKNTNLRIAYLNLQKAKPNLYHDYLCNTIKFLAKFNLKFLT